jgi:hypothetical protein
MRIVFKNGPTKIIQVSNPVDPLKSSNKEKSVQKAGFVLLWLQVPKAGNHGLKNLQSLDFAKPEIGYPQINFLQATGLQDK